jgi:hypothetical protein
MRNSEKSGLTLDRFQIYLRVSTQHKTHPLQDAARGTIRGTRYSRVTIIRAVQRNDAFLFAH